jgi:hypothetical protein
VENYDFYGYGKIKAPHYGSKNYTDSVQINNQGFFSQVQNILTLAVVISAST